VNPRPIAVFDSGVGGLTVFHALERALPGESLVYLGDTARVPYGTKSPDTVVRYSREAARFLGRHEVKLLVVACNTASSVALPSLVDPPRVPVIGVIEPGARRAVERSRTGRIGVIGTRATVASGAYVEAIHALAPAAQVTSRPCPLFVPLAEEGWTDDDVAERVAERYLAPFREERVDVLVLGCTHYPLLRDVIARVVGPGVELVDSAEAVAADVRRRLEREPELAAGRAAGRDLHRFYVTDAPEPFQAVAERFLGRSVERLERVRIEGE
jgi:glutamate racemase